MINPEDDDSQYTGCFNGEYEEGAQCLFHYLARVVLARAGESVNHLSICQTGKNADNVLW